jgi:uncharacterized RDD family membrane protein YckC
MNGNSKLCPMCAEDIPLDAEVCQYCGARFDVKSRGYCRNCHKMQDADVNGRCSVCGETLQDWHIDSQLVDEQKFVLSPSQSQPKPVEISEQTLQVLEIKGESVFYRFNAIFIDLMIITLIFSTVVLVFSLLQQGLDLREQSSLMNIFSGTILLSGPIIWFLYFFIFEGGFSATPGKALSHLRVIKKDGGRLNWGQAAVRALFSIFEDNLIGAIVIWATKQNQRIGDLVAGTLVVNKEKVYQAEMSPPKLALVFHDHRRVVFNRLVEGTLERFMTFRLLKLVGFSDENRPLQTKIKGHFFRSEFDMLCLNLQERYQIVFNKKVIVWRLIMFILTLLITILVLIGALVTLFQNQNTIFNQSSPRGAIAEFQSSATIVSSPVSTQTTVPTATQKPAATATPLPVEANFDTLGELEDGQLVILIGRLAMMSSTFCDYQCGLLLENPSNTNQNIVLFVVTGDKPNQMKPLSDNYTKGDIQVRLDDGSIAYVGYRLQVTGRKCTTDQGNPCISSIQKIDLFQIP